MISLKWRRMLSSVAVMVITSAMLFGGGFQIDDYEFNVTGVTNTSRIYEYLGLADNIAFESHEMLEEFAASKAQELSNSRLFKSVDYAIVEKGEGHDGILHFTLVFSLDDASSFLVLPYPKYDSNYGFSLGLKAYNRNLGGTLSSLKLTTKVKQNDHSFAKGDYYAELELVKYPIASFDADAAIAININPLQPEDSFFLFDLSAYNMKLGSALEFSFSPGIKLTTSESNENLFAWGFDNAHYSVNLSEIWNSIGGFSIDHSLKYHPRSKLLETKNYLNYYGFSLQGNEITTRFGIETHAVLNDSVFKITASEYIAVPLCLPGDFRLTPSAMVYQIYSPDGTLNMINWASEKRLAAGITLSRSNVNYVMEGSGDFRRGLSLRLTGMRDMYLMDFLDSPYQYAEAELSYFPYANSWFNPAVRITGSISSEDSKRILPSFEEDSPDMTDLMRGILEHNEHNTGWDFQFAVNLNLMAKCFNLGSFARTYVIPFFDFALMKDMQSSAAPVMLCTAGIEGIGIMNNHPSYPIRASLGFNLEKLAKAIRQRDITAVEYELFIGLDFFY